MSRYTCCIGGLCLLVLGGGSAWAGSIAKEADSLFAEGRYLSAYRLYRQLQLKGGQQTAYLLRMAYIQEGLQQYPAAFYHLMDYYARSQDTRVWEKIQELSKLQEVKGYSLSENEQLIIWLLKQRVWGFTIVGSLWLVFVGICLGRGRGRMWRAVGLLLVSCCLVLMFQRQVWLPQRAVVLADNVKAHLGPSGAAPQSKELLAAGTLLYVQASTQLWTKVIWNERLLYLRTHQLGLIRYD